MNQISSCQQVFYYIKQIKSQNVNGMNVLDHKTKSFQIIIAW